AAIWLVWLGRSGQAAPLAAVRLGLVAAIPITAIAGWLFQASDYQARWESLMAIGATGIVLATGLSVWRGVPVSEAPAADRRPMLWQVAIAAAAALIVCRQTMVMAAGFLVAAFQIRSLDATAAIAGAAALAFAAAVGWVWLGNRLSQRGVLNATRTFAVVF